MLPQFSRDAGSLRALLAAPLAAAFAASALSACAATASAPVVGAMDMRVMIKLVKPSGDSVGIAAEVSRHAGVPADYMAAVSAAWHVIALHCPDVSTCQAAVLRLRQTSSVYEAVELDGRKRATT